MGVLRTGRGIVRLAVGCGALCGATAAFAQAPAAAAAPVKCPGASATEGKPCPPPPSTAQQFPYPGEQPAGHDAPARANPQTAAPDAPAQSGGTAPSTAKQFPYPGEDPESGSSASSSSSSSSSSSGSGGDPAAAPADGSPLKDAGSEGENTRRRKLPKVTKLQSDEDRESEDLDVAKYYLSAGSPMAAYLRSKDAVKLKPNDPEAHFSLGQAAAKLKKHDEAVAEFQQYLQLEPDGQHVKDARKLLAEVK